VRATIYLCLLWALSACSSTTQHQPPALPLYVYHDMPPFLMADAGSSLSDLVATSLSHFSRQTFNVEPIGRPALNQLLASGKPVLVLWANKKWLPGIPLKSSTPILLDSDILVALKHNAIITFSRSALANSRFCAIRGHHYSHLEPDLSQALINRIDADNHQQCLALLKSGQVDYIQLERSFFYNDAFTLERNNLRAIEPAMDSFTRHILMANGAQEHSPLINAALQQLKTSTYWQTGLSQLGSERFVNLFDVGLELLQELEIH